MPVDSNDEDFKKLNLHHLEIVFQFGENVVYRDDMRSMEFCQEVSSGVIIAWAALLNDMEKKQRHPKSRFFFGMHHSFFFQQLINDRNERNEAELDTIRQKLRNNLKSWITENNCLYHIKSSKMIFIPMLIHNHYFCVVVNFDLKLLQYLDNRKYTDSDKAIFMSYAQMMVDELSVVMDNLVDRRWIEVHSYECKIVNFGWMSKALNSDCGVFLMLHMLFFKGFEFKADFDKAMRRRVYRTAIAAAIILSDRNGVRQEILSKLKAFNGKKKNIQLMMLEKKKKRKQEEKEKREEEEKEKKKQKS